MEPARCCLADCYFQSCNLSLALARACLEELARQSHFAGLINIVHYVRAAGGFVAVGIGWRWWVVSISWGAPWIRGKEEFGLLITCVLLFTLLLLLTPPQEKKKNHVKAVLFHLHQNQFPLLPLAPGMQAKQWQRNYKQGDFLLRFCLPHPRRAGLSRWMLMGLGGVRWVEEEAWGSPICRSKAERDQWAPDDCSVCHNTLNKCDLKMQNACRTCHS